MEYLYEAIEHNAQLPIKIFTQTVLEFPFHWHDDTEILFVLKGKIEIIIENRITRLNEGHIFIVNKNEFHFINSINEKKPSQLLVLQFDMAYFRKFNLKSDELSFHLQYIKENGVKRKAYNKIRGILASLMSIVVNKEEPGNLLIERHLLDLIIVLINHYSVDNELKESSHSDARIVEIIKYIRINFANHDIGVEQIADEFHLNPQYLSRHFKEKLGISMKKFIDNTRLNKSLQALKSTDERILDLALTFGFPDAKAYYRVFKEVMGITPAQYREEHKVTVNKHIQKDYFSINSKDTLSKLFQYLQNYRDSFSGEDKEVTRENTIVLSRTGEPFYRVSQKIMTFGYAPHGLRGDFLVQIEQIQRDMPFEYIRFHGIFSDEMLLYNERENGEIYYNFIHIDRLFDSLLELGLKPFLELGFMPSKLASTDKTIFWWKSYISPPKDLSKWTNMIDSFIRHLINRYGISEVLSWYFEFWNEPELEGIFWDGNIQDFYTLFKSTFQAIKNIDERLMVGGFGNINTGSSWIKDYEKMAKEDNLKMDFFTFHVYQVQFTGTVTMEEEFNELSKMDFNWNANVMRSHIFNAELGGPEVLKESIDLITGIVKDLEIADENYFITEWNANTDCRDLVHDTCFMAPFIVKNVLENFKAVKGMGFWTATDLHEEFRLPQPLFHGGFGLMTFNGIKKPAYHGFSFLSQLGNEILFQSESAIITREDINYQILIFNYVHYNELYTHFDYSQITQTNRYDVFQESSIWRQRLNLKGISGYFKVEQQRVNRKNGSSFDAWVEMGAPEELSPKAYSSLQKASEPSFRTWNIQANREVNIDIDVDPHEIQLITLQRIY